MQRLAVFSKQHFLKNNANFCCQFFSPQPPNFPPAAGKSFLHQAEYYIQYVGWHYFNLHTVTIALSQEPVSGSWFWASNAGTKIRSRGGSKNKSLNNNIYGEIKKEVIWLKLEHFLLTKHSNHFFNGKPGWLG